ncbi:MULTISPECIES: type II toxin-antitoxin system VapC family toxin [Sorangium]|uniref:type II toxin-antitoxin system VapC family toxin n=1 Tax=Sorangium TaxID=39643 RepID=UPI003D9C52A9
MSLRFLLDTNIVSAPVASKPNLEIVRRLEQHAQECAIGAPVWHELVYGCRRLPRGRRRTALEAYIEGVVRASFPILPYDDAAAAWHGAERARLEELGSAAPYVDGQIAAIAHANELVLVTANTKDFVRFKDLESEDWSRRRAR